MKTPITLVPVAALLVAGALAGCGGDDKTGADGATSPSAQAAAPTTPQESWANKLCTTMAGKAKTVQPPAVSASSPAATMKGLIAFFGDVGDQLDDQVAAIKEVGPPPGAEAEADWNQAVKRMEKTNDEVTEIRKGLRGAGANSAADINAVVADLGKQMASLTKYEGPVAELSKNKTLSDAIVNEPACAKVS